MVSKGAIPRSIMTEDLINGARQLTLEHPASRRNLRKSTLDSAEDAKGIFDLYGGGRDSWRSDELESGPSARGLKHSAPDERMDKGQMEELAGSPASLANRNGQLPVSTRGHEEEHEAGFESSGIAPPITVTAANTPERVPFAEKRNSTFTSVSSVSPTHPSIAKISPRLPRSSNTSARTSQMDIAGSSQYPGEDDDAFHVRSTCESQSAPG